MTYEIHGQLNGTDQLIPGEIYTDKQKANEQAIFLLGHWDNVHIVERTQ